MSNTCASFMVNLVAIRPLYHCLLRVFSSFSVASLIAISIWRVPKVIGVYCVCALSDTISNNTFWSKALNSGILSQTSTYPKYRTSKPPEPSIHRMDWSCFGSNFNFFTHVHEIADN